METIGDCYVAVSGLPEFVPEHAVNMARFAQDIMMQMNKIVKQLEVTLGPETAELALRIGINRYEVMDETNVCSFCCLSRNSAEPFPLWNVSAAPSQQGYFEEKSPDFSFLVIQ